MNTMLLDGYTADKVKDYLPSPRALESLKRFFSAFSDVTRLKIVSALSVTPMCVSDISNTVGLNQTTVSHNLAILKNAGILESVRQGKVMFYSLCGGEVPKIMGLAVDSVFGNRV